MNATQVTVLEREIACSKKAAQAAAEAAAQDIAALSTALMEAQSQCCEVEAARSEVRHHSWAALRLAQIFQDDPRKSIALRRIDVAGIRALQPFE